MNIVEHLREQVIKSLLNVKSFNRNWDSCWKQEILDIIKINNQYDTNKILNLGDSLAHIFQLSNDGRTQSGVSTAGATWEALVCYYLNLCLINTNVVVIKQLKAHVPEPISNALTVMYGASPSNTEADLIAIVFPNNNEYSENINALQNYPIFSDIKLFSRQNRFQYLKALNLLVDRDASNIEINVIQCKTNWNDNAQIPMLWDMVYSAQGFRENNISVGINNYSLDSFKAFSYSFVTVPTTNLEKIKENSVCVKRVFTLSGGNYWGHPTKNNIAMSIKEIINRNFSHGISPNIRTTLTNSLPEIDSNFSYFNL